MEEEFRYDQFAPKQFETEDNAKERAGGKFGLEESYIELELITSGEHAEIDFLYEITARKYEQDQLTETFKELVRPENYYLLSKDEAERKEDYCIIDGGPVYFMDKYMCSITGITNQMLFEARSQREVLTEFRDFVGETKLVGKSRSWQIPFLNALLEEEELELLERDVKEDQTPYLEGISSLEGKVCVFTGTLTGMVRGKAMGLVRSRGGIIGTSISKKTDVLILGKKEEQARAHGNKSTKLMRAERLIREGQSLCLLSEAEFYKIVGYDENL